VSQKGAYYFIHHIHATPQDTSLSCCRWTHATRCITSLCCTQRWPLSVW